MIDLNTLRLLRVFKNFDEKSLIKMGEWECFNHTSSSQSSVI